MNPYTKDELLLITKSVMKILDNWELDSFQIISILGLPDKTPKRNINKYRNNLSFPYEKEIFERLEHIIGISDALRTTFPRNQHMASGWLKTEHRRFNNKAPIEVIIQEGLNGLRKIRSELDCTFAWDTTTG